MDITLEERQKLLERYRGGRVPPLNELINPEHIEVFLRGYVETKDIPLAIVYPSGDWQKRESWKTVIDTSPNHRLYKPFCTFCRKFEDCDSKKMPLLDRCNASNTSHAYQAAIKQERQIYVCWNGLIDLAMPVIWNNQTIAVVLTGQFLPEEGEIWNTKSLPWDVEEELRGTNVNLREKCREKIDELQNQINTLPQAPRENLWSLAQQHLPLSPDDIEKQMTMLKGVRALLEDVAGARMEAEEHRLQNYFRGELLKAPLDWQKFWEFLEGWIGKWCLSSNTYVYGVAGTLGDTEAWVPFAINTGDAKKGRYKITEAGLWTQLLKLKPGEWRTRSSLGLLYKSGFSTLGGRVISLGKHGFLVYGPYKENSPDDQSESIRKFGYDISLLLDNIQTARAREDFLTHFAHELRSPINNASIIIERIQQKHFEHSPQRFDEKCRRLRAQLDRLLKMIENVWELQKILTGKTIDGKERESSRTNLYGVLQRCASQSKDMTEREDLQIVVGPEIKDLCSIDLDLEGFELAVFNLLDNAIKYSSDGTEIRVHGRQVRGEIVLTFTNIGLKIPHKEDEDVFDRFVRTKEATCRAPESAGIGLFLVKNIVEAHGGRAEASSEPHGPRDYLVKIELHLPTRL